MNMNGASNLPPYNTIPGAGRLVGEPPFTFSGVVLRVFPFQANGQKLQRFVSRCLNVMPDEIAYYRLALPYIYALTVSYEEMALDAIQGNWISQQEITLSIALERYRRVRGRLVFQDWTWFSPYILVDEELSQMTGREVYGWPKELGRLGQREGYWERHPRTPRSLFRLSAPAVTFRGGRPQFRYEPLFDVDQLPPTSYLQFRPREQELLRVPLKAARSAAETLARSMDMGAFLLETWGAGAIGMELDGAIPPSFPPAALFRELLRRPTNSTTTLKQFRDEVYPKRICYQAVVSAPLGLQRFRNVGLLGEAAVLWGDTSGGYNVRLYDDLTHPIARNLGLINIEDTGTPMDPGGRAYVDLTPVLPFWLEADLTYGKGIVVGWRDHRNEWRTERGGRSWVFKPRDKNAPPLFNGVLGGAPEQILSRLNPTPKENDSTQLPSWVQHSLNTPGDREGEEDDDAAGREIESKEDETPDLRLQRATYLVFGFKAKRDKLVDTCHRYLAENGEFRYAPIELDDHGEELKVDPKSAPKGNQQGWAGVYLLFGIIEQFGGRPTLGGESWRVFDVQLGFPVRRTGQDEPKGPIYFVVPYQFTDRTLASIVAREFYGWPVVASNVRVSKTAWLDAQVSAYSMRYKAKGDDNEFFEVAVDGPEGQTIKVFEMLLQSGSPGSPRVLGTSLEEYTALEELIRVVSARLEGEAQSQEDPSAKGAPPAWSPARVVAKPLDKGKFTNSLKELFVVLSRDTEPKAEEIKKMVLGLRQQLLKYRGEAESVFNDTADSTFRIENPSDPKKSKVDEEGVRRALHRLETACWDRHSLIELASRFMNADGNGPVLIHRVGLKQFRAADAPTRACYQSLVQTPIALDDWSDSKGRFRGRPYLVWFRPGRKRQAIVRFNRDGWGSQLVAVLGLTQNPNLKDEDLGYTEPEQWFRPFFMSGQLKIYRSRRLAWRTGPEWHTESKR